MTAGVRVEQIDHVELLCQTAGSLKAWIYPRSRS